MVVHFSLGSFLSSHGFSISALFTRREWKYVGGGTGCKPVLDPIADAGIDPYGETKGLRCGARSMGSLSGVPGRVLLAVVVAVVAVVPLW
jgi:hypothetical protein